MSQAIMQRRDFMTFVAALSASVVIPTFQSDPRWLEKFRRTGVIEGETITLKRTLVIPMSLDCTITNCKFDVADDFEGDYMFELQTGSSLTFTFNVVDGGGKAGFMGSSKRFTARNNARVDIRQNNFTI